MKPAAPVLALALSLMLALPGASAQIVSGEPPRDRSPATVTVSPPTPEEAQVRAENRETRANIERSRDAGLLTKRQAKALRKEGRMNDSLTERYARDGLSYSESRELDMRARALDSLVGAPGTPAKAR